MLSEDFINNLISDYGTSFTINDIIQRIVSKYLRNVLDNTTINSITFEVNNIYHLFYNDGDITVEDDDNSFVGIFLNFPSTHKDNLYPIILNDIRNKKLENILNDRY